jgi:hypothetical protein
MDVDKQNLETDDDDQDRDEEVDDQDDPDVSDEGADDAGDDDGAGGGGDDDPGEQDDAGADDAPDIGALLEQMTGRMEALEQRIAGSGGEPGREDRPPADVAPGKGKREQEIADFMAKRIRALRRDHPEHYEGTDDQAIGDYIRGTGEFELFEQLLDQREQVGAVIDAVLEIRDQIATREIADPTFDMNDEYVQDLLRRGNTAQEAYVLWKHKNGGGPGGDGGGGDGDGKGRGRRGRRQNLRSGKPRGTPSKGRGGGGGKPRMTAEQRKYAKAMGLSEEEYMAD